jgi:hypothetical protein
MYGNGKQITLHEMIEECEKEQELLKEEKDEDII